MIFTPNLRWVVTRSYTEPYVMARTPAQAERLTAQCGFAVKMWEKIPQRLVTR